MMSAMLVRSSVSSSSSLGVCRGVPSRVPRCSVRAFGSTAPLQAKARIGFIGLGNMGGHMAANLSKAGHPLVLFDVNQDAVANTLKAAPGSSVASTPRAVAEQSDSVITMLPSSPHVQKVYLDKAEGLIGGMKQGALLIDTSTIDPMVAREVAAEVEKHGGTMVDAPVSGGVGGAEKATLTFMVGGSKENFARAEQILQFMGKNIVHCGGAGNGQVVKVCNNLVLAISMIGVSEAMNLGITLGMDPKILAGIFNSSSARCWTSDTYNPVPGVMEGVPASRDYTGGFGVDLMKKDLGLAVAAAQKGKIPLLLGSTALDIYKVLSDGGYGKKDFSSIYKFLDTFKRE